jgi:phage terminase small subunit
MAELKNAQWELYAQAYIHCFNKTEAAMKAGYAPDSKHRSATCAVIGNELYQRPIVRERIAELLKERRQEYAVTEDRVVAEMSRIAFADITELMESFDNGTGITYKSLDQIPKRLRPVIKKITQGQNGISIELHDKVGAIEQLAKYLGIYEKDNKQKSAPAPQIYLPHNRRDDLDKSSDDAIMNGDQPSPYQA